MDNPGVFPQRYGGAFPREFGQTVGAGGGSAGVADPRRQPAGSSRPPPPPPGTSTCAPAPGRRCAISSSASSASTPTSTTRTSGKGLPCLAVAACLVPGSGLRGPRDRPPAPPRPARPRKRRQVVRLELEPHLNTCFRHFVLFVHEFGLVEPRELGPMRELIDRMVGPSSGGDGGGGA